MPLLLACAACGSQAPSERMPTYPATGRILVEGKALAGALVTFHPQDGAGEPRWTSHGKTDARGEYSLSTYAEGDGAPAGRYAVTVLLQQGEEGITLLPLRYTDPRKSGLSAEIKAQANQLPPMELRRK